MLARGDLDHAGNGDLAAADEIIHLVFLEEKFDALRHLRRDGPRALPDFFEIERQALDAEAEEFRLLKSPVNLRAFQQRLGGNAAPIEAGATGAFQFDAGHLLAKLSGPDG